MTLYRTGVKPVTLSPENEFTLPDLLRDFRVRVGRLFE
jgi:hypothetical protein